MADQISILIKAILEKSSKQELTQELKQIEKNLKPLDIKIGINDETQIKLFKSMQKIEKEQAKINSNQEKASAKAIADNEKQLQYEQKVRKAIDETIIKEKQVTQEIQKQLALYKEQLAIKNQNLKTAYGKSYDSAGMSSVLNSANGLNASDFKTVNELKNTTKQLDLQVEKSTAGMKSLRKESTLALKESDGFMTTLTKDFGKIVAWTITGTALFGSLRQLQEGIGFLVEQSKVFTNLQMEMTNANLVFKEVLGTANDYAKAMGTTTDTVMKAISVFSTYTSTMDEVLQKSKAGIILNNITGQGIETTADALMGTLAQYKLAAEDSMHVADIITGTARMLQIDYPKAVQEISDGLRTVGAVARESGASIELTASMVGTISEKNRRTGIENSNALRTIFGRILNVGEDADPEAMKKVEAALHGIGVRIREIGDDQSLRPIGNILEDLSGKWQKLTDVQRQNIAFEAAGMYRKNTFITLMENYGDVIKNTEAALNSNGVAMQKQEIFQNNLQSSLNKLTAEWESFWKNSLDSNTIKNVVDILTTLISTFGNLPMIITLVTTALIIFKQTAIVGAISSLVSFNLSIGATIAANGMLATSLGGVIFAFKALTLAMATNPLIAMALAITGVVSILSIYNQVSEETRKAEEERKADREKEISTITSQIDSINNQSKSLKELGDAYVELSSKAKLSDAENKQLIDTQNKLAELFPSLINYYDSEGNAHLKNAEAISIEVQKLRELKAIKESEKKDYYADKIKDEQKAVEEYSQAIKNWQESAKVTQNRKADSDGNIENIIGQKVNKEEVLKQNREGIVNFRNEIENSNTKINEYIASVKSGIPELSSFSAITLKISDNLSASLNKKLSEGKISVDEFVKSYVNIADKIQGQNLDSQYRNYSLLTDGYSKGSVSIEEVKSAYDELNKSLVKVGITAENTDMFLQLPDSATASLSKYFTTLQTNFDEALTKLDEYKKYLDEINDKGLTQSSLKSIIKDHQELIPYLSDEKTLQTELNRIIAEQEKIATDTYTNMMLADKTFSTNVLNNRVGLINDLSSKYGVDLKNYATLAESKLAIEKNLILEIAGSWAKYYDAQGNLNDTFDTEMSGQENENKPTRLLQNKYNKGKKLETTIKNALKNVDKDFSKIVDKTDFSSILKNGNDSDQADKAKKAIEDAKKRGEDTANAFIEGYNKKIQAQENKISMLGEIDTIAEKQKLVTYREEILKQYTSERDELKRKIDYINKEVSTGINGETGKKLTSTQKVEHQAKLDVYNKEYAQSQIDVVSATSVLIDAEYQSATAKYEVQKANSGIIKQQIELAKAQGDSAEAIKQTNKLIASEIKEKTALTEANNKLQTSADKLLSNTQYSKYKSIKNGKDKWFNETGNTNETYNTEISNRQAAIAKEKDKTKKASLQLELDAIIKFASAYSDYLKNMADVKAKMTESDIEMAQLQTQLAEEKLDNLKAVEDKTREILEKSRDEKKRLLDEELDDVKTNVEAKLKLLDAQYNKEDYKKDVAKQSKVITDLESQEFLAKKDTSLSGKAKLISIQDQLKTEREKLEELQTNHQRDLQKEGLQNIIDTEELRVKAAKESLNTIYSDENINKIIKSALDTGYLIDPNGSGLIDLTTLYLNFENKFGDGMTVLGDKIKNDFVANIKLALESFNTLVDDIEAVSGLDFKLTATQSKAFDSGALPIAGAAGGGMTPNKYPNGMLTVLHPNELIPNPVDSKLLFDASKLLKSIDIQNMLIPKFNMPQFAGIGGGGIQISMPITVQGNIDRDTYPKFQQTVKNASTEIRSILTRVGTGRN